MTALPASVADRVRSIIGTVRRAEAVGGGCIANATRVDAERGTFFLKWSAGDAGHTFEAEAVGLRALRRAGAPLVVPDVLAVRDAHDQVPGYLVLEWIESGAPGRTFWEGFGRALAAFHRATEPEGRYGFEADNFIGRTPQRNTWHSAWPEFFCTQRLAPQIEWAQQAGHWRSDWTPHADRLLGRLGELLPGNPSASILHGDLWSGNFLPVVDGRAALIDPAAYYGHRETDLALSELFGGFGARFYDAYRAAWPLESGYPARREVYNLYHLLNHLNLFGFGYAGGVERILKRF